MYVDCTARPLSFNYDGNSSLLNGVRAYHANQRVEI